LGEGWGFFVMGDLRKFFLKGLGCMGLMDGGWLCGGSGVKRLGGLGGCFWGVGRG